MMRRRGWIYLGMATLPWVVIYVIYLLAAAGAG